MFSAGALLAACARAPQSTPQSGTQPTAESPAAEEKPAEATAAPAAGSVALRYGLSWVSLPEHHKAEENMAAEFSQQNPNIKVDWEDYDPQKFLVQAAAQAAPDVIIGPVLEWGPAGGIIDLFPYANADSTFNTDDFAEVPLNENVWREKLYWVPNAAITWNIFYYNQDLFDQAGVAYPDLDKNWTWEYFLDACQKMTVMSGDRVERQGYANWWYNAMAGIFVESNHGRWFNDDMTEVAFNQPEAVEALQFLADLVHKYNVAPNQAQEAAVGGKAFEMTGFANQRIAMATSGTWEMSILRDAPFKVGFSMVPVSKPEYLGERIGYVGSGFCLAISASCKTPNEAWQFLNYSTRYDAQLQRAWNFPARKSAAAKLLEAPPEQYWPKPLLQTMVDMANSPTAAKCQERNIQWDSDFRTAFQNHWDTVKLGQSTAQDAMDKAADECNTILKKWATQ